MAITGTRFVNAMALRTPATGVQDVAQTPRQAQATASSGSPDSGEERPAKWQRATRSRPAASARNVKPPSHNNTPGHNNVKGDVAAANAITGTSKTAVTALDGIPASVSLHLLLDIIAGAAPGKLSVAGALAFIDTANYCMAMSVLDKLPAYLAPFLRDAPYLEVRIAYKYFSACHLCPAYQYDSNTMIQT
jgi:hypothetical protein